MKYGYARVGTDDQNPALQLAALKGAGCKTVFKDEGKFGATTKRPALSQCLKALQPRDTLISFGGLALQNQRPPRLTYVMPPFLRSPQIGFTLSFDWAWPCR